MVTLPPVNFFLRPTSLKTITLAACPQPRSLEGIRYAVLVTKSLNGDGELEAFERAWNHLELVGVPSPERSSAANRGGQEQKDDAFVFAIMIKDGDAKNPPQFPRQGGHSDPFASPRSCREYSRAGHPSLSSHSCRLPSSSSSLTTELNAHMEVDFGIRTSPHPAQATPIGYTTASSPTPHRFSNFRTSSLTFAFLLFFHLAAYKIKHAAKHNLPSFLTKPLPIAHMQMENTVHYDLRTDLGILQWNNATLPGPNHDGILWLTMKGGERKPFTFSLFHQLRCLNIIRESLMARRHPPYTEPSRLAIHCMNYIRQMVLCRADLTLESARNPVGPNTVVSDVTHVCRDWSVVWDQVQGDESYHRK